MPMEYDRKYRGIIISGLSAASVLGVLTALRVFQLEPSVAVQSRIVQVGIALLIISQSYLIFHGETLSNSWLYTFGPTFGFTLNLFITTSTMSLYLKILYPLASAVIVTSVIWAVSYSIAMAARVL